ncbi:hypothetical protein ACQBAU_09740 [Propionibacteriaceae bacterium Y2011]|uniref:hypothetical protein n=1 Tax=Microlunatus sp. Y2014 TaxID=3418488 RepID=UPI003B488FB2
MSQVIRSSGAKVNFVVGPMVMVIGVGALVTAVVLSVVMETPGFLALLIPAALALGGGAFIVWMARRARLQIDAEGFTWCGFFGPEQSLGWARVHRLLPPPPGAKRMAALAQLRDNSVVEVRALWQSPTSPLTLLGATDHRAEFEALVTAHRAWLARQR